MQIVFCEIKSKELDEAIKGTSWFWTDALDHKSMQVDKNKTEVLTKCYIDYYLLIDMSFCVFD